MDLIITDLRRSYTRDGLPESHADPNPFAQFAGWLQQAISAKLHEPNAMTLATVSPQNLPSARMVLLKGFDEGGFVFYTNYGSRKAGDLEVNPQVALLFWWDVLERQVRIEGRADKIPAEISDEYFRSRPRGSQLGAWASEQSRVIPGREVLERQLRELEEKYAGVEVPRPRDWGGYRVVPHTIEFWQGRPNRLHDRLQYTHREDGGWKMERLSP